MSAFTRNSFTKVFRIRPKDGMSAPPVRHIPQKASETILKHDLLEITSGVAERMIDPTGTADYITITAGTPRYLALESQTTGASPGRETTIACYDLNDIDMLVRLYDGAASELFSASTASASEQDDFDFNTGYDMGIYEFDANSNNYVNVLTAATTGGDFEIVEYSAESNAADDYGLVWVSLINTTA